VEQRELQRVVVRGDADAGADPVDLQRELVNQQDGYRARDQVEDKVCDRQAPAGGIGADRAQPWR